MWDPVEEYSIGNSCLLLGFCDFPDHLRRGTRLVHTERLFGQEVPGGSVSARPASHADMAEFTATALPFQVVVIAQLAEHHRVSPDVGKTLLPQVAGDGGQITAGEDFSLVRDKAHTGSSQAALGHRIHVAGMASGMTRVTYRRPAARLQRYSCRSRHRHFGGANAV